MAPIINAQRGTKTKLKYIFVRFSSLAQSVRQNANFRSMATKYQILFFRSWVALCGSKPGLQRPTILTIIMRRRIVSNVHTGRNIRNQFQWIFSSSFSTSMIRKTSVNIQVRSTLCARDMFGSGLLSTSRSSGNVCLSVMKT